MDHREINRAAWNSEVGKRNYWTIPVDAEAIDRARQGCPMIHLTPIRYMPISWLEETGKRTLLLGGGGGQQGPLLAAYGKSVTTVDISEEQLEGDRLVAEREALDIRTVRCDMRELDFLQSGEMELVICPQAINFIDGTEKLYDEVARVLAKGGVFILSFANPALYLFDVKSLERGRMKIRYTLPFNAETSLSERQRERIAREKGTMEYSHTLSSLIGSLLEKGFVLSAMYTDGSDFEPVDSYLSDCHIALRLIRV